MIARTDARAPLGLDAAIDRANAYAEAGADVLFVEAPQSVEEIERIGRGVRAPADLPCPGWADPDRIPRGSENSATPSPSSRRCRSRAARLRDADQPGRTRGNRDPAPLVPTKPADFFILVGLAEWSELGDRYRTEGA